MIYMKTLHFFYFDHIYYFKNCDFNNNIMMKNNPCLFFPSILHAYKFSINILFTYLSYIIF